MSTIQSPGPRGNTGGGVPTSADALLAELGGNTDLAWLVERVIANDLPWVVVPAAALRAWEERDLVGWAKVTAWLAASGVAVIHI